MMPSSVRRMGPPAPAAVVSLVEEISLVQEAVGASEAGGASEASAGVLESPSSELGRAVIMSAARGAEKKEAASAADQVA